MFGDRIDNAAFPRAAALPAKSPAARVLLVHRSEIVRSGLREILDRDPGLDVVGESDSVLATMRAVWRHSPEVIIVEAGLPHGGVVQLARAGRALHPGLRWVVLSRADPEAARAAATEAAAADASGYVTEDARGEELCGILRRVAGGEHVGDQRGRAQVGSAPAVHLTAREREVLAFITLGLTNRQIGNELGLAEKTVKNYVSALLSKLHVERRAQAAVYGFWREDRSGLRDPGGSGAARHNGAPAPGGAEI